MITLGATYKDRITGFVGVCIGSCQYLTGCNQALLQPEGKKADVRPECEWFDVQRLVQQGKKLVVLDNGPTPGCDREAPKR